MKLISFGRASKKLGGRHASAEEAVKIGPLTAAILYGHVAL
jgi:hypothetical protein